MLAIGLAKPEQAARAMADAKSVDTGLPRGKRLLPYGALRLVAPIARRRQGRALPTSVQACRRRDGQTRVRFRVFVDVKNANELYYH